MRACCCYQAIFGSPKPQKSPKENLSDKASEATTDREPAEEFPLTARAGGHDLDENNWAQRSQRMAALARKNEAAELEAKMRLGKLSRREQQLLGPSLLAEVEANVVAQQQAEEVASNSARAIA